METIEKFSYWNTFFLPKKFPHDCSFSPFSERISDDPCSFFRALFTSTTVTILIVA